MVHRSVIVLGVRAAIAKPYSERMGARLTEWLDVVGLTQLQVSDRLAVSRGTTAPWFAGRTAPPGWYTEELAELFGSILGRTVFMDEVIGRIPIGAGDTPKLKTPPSKTDPVKLKMQIVLEMLMAVVAQLPDPEERRSMERRLELLLEIKSLPPVVRV